MPIFFLFFFLLALNDKWRFIVIFDICIIFIFFSVDIINFIGAYWIIIIFHKYHKFSITYMIIFLSKDDFPILVEIIIFLEELSLIPFYIIRYNMSWTFCRVIKCIYIFLFFKKISSLILILLHRFEIF